MITYYQKKTKKNLSVTNKNRGITGGSNLDNRISDLEPVQTQMEDTEELKAKIEEELNAAQKTEESEEELQGEQIQLDDEGNLG